MKLYHLASHLHFTVPMTTAFHPHIHSGPNPRSALPTVNQHSTFHSQDTHVLPDHSPIWSSHFLSPSSPHKMLSLYITQQVVSTCI